MIHIALIDDDPVELIILKGFSGHLEGNFEWKQFTTIQEFTDEGNPNQFSIVFLDRKLPPYVSFDDTVPILEECGFTGRVVLMSADANVPAPKSDKFEILGPVDKLKMQNLDTLQALLNSDD